MLNNLNDDLNNFNEHKNENGEIIYLNIPKKLSLKNWEETILDNSTYYHELISNQNQIIQKYKLNFDQITNTLFDFESDFTLNKTEININNPMINKGLIFSRGYNIFEKDNAWCLIMNKDYSEINLIPLNIENENDKYKFNIFKIFNSTYQDFLKQNTSYYNMRLLCYWLYNKNPILDYSWLFRKTESKDENIYYISKNKSEMMYSIKSNYIQNYNTKYLKIFYINFDSLSKGLKPKTINDEIRYFFNILCTSIKSNEEEYLNIENIPIYIKDDKNKELLNIVDRTTLVNNFPKFILVDKSSLINNLDFNREIILIETNNLLQGDKKRKILKLYKTFIQILNDSFTKYYNLNKESQIKFFYNDKEYIIFLKDIYKEYPTTCQIINYKELCFNIRKHKLIPDKITTLDRFEQKELMKNLFKSESLTFKDKLPKIRGIYTFNNDKIKPDPLSTFFGWNSNNIVKFNSFNKTHYRTVIDNSNYTSILNQDRIMSFLNKKQFVDKYKNLFKKYEDIILNEDNIDDYFIFYNLISNLNQQLNKRANKFYCILPYNENDIKLRHLFCIRGIQRKDDYKDESNKPIADFTIDYFNALNEGQDTLSECIDLNKDKKF